MDVEIRFTPNDILNFLKRNLFGVNSGLVLLLATWMFFYVDFDKEAKNEHTVQELVQRMHENEKTIATLKQQMLQSMDENEALKLRMKETDKKISVLKEEMERKIRDIELIQNQRHDDYRKDMKELGNTLLDFSTRHKLTDNELNNINSVIKLITHSMEKDSKIQDQMRQELNRYRQSNQEMESRLKEAERRNSGFISRLIQRVDDGIDTFVNKRKRLT